MFLRKPEKIAIHCIHLYLIIALSLVMLTRCSSLLTKPISSLDLDAYGNGIIDATEVLQRALDIQSSINLGKGTFRITKQLKITKSNIIVKGDDAQLVFDGSYSERLLWIEASNLSFQGVKFSGNYKQVKGSLLYIGENSKNVHFTTCIFSEIEGKHQGPKSNYSNAQYAIMIHPQQVDCKFIDCKFEDITNDNSGKYLPPYIGGGFVGGVFFYYHDFKKQANIDTNPTKCTFKRCSFENIRTILAEKLPVSKQIDLNDADAIRTYSPEGDTLYLQVISSTFKNIGKRAVKFSGSKGGIINDCTIITANLLYPMVTAVKLSSNNQLENIRIEGSSEKPIRIAFQMHNAQDILIENITINYCRLLLNSAPTNKKTIISNINLNNIVCHNCQGGVVNSSLASKVQNVRIENIKILNTNNQYFLGFENLIASSQDNENHFRNIEIENGSMKITGFNNTINGVKISINDQATESLFAKKRCLFEGFGAKNNTNSLANLEINISRIPKGYFDDRQSLILFYGNYGNYSDISLKVNSLSTNDETHISILGNNHKVENLQYKGFGTITIGSSVSSRNLEITNIRREKVKSENIPTFIEIKNAENLILRKVVDLSSGNNVTIDCLKAKNCKIINVKSASRNSKIINERENSIISKNISRKLN